MAICRGEIKLRYKLSNSSKSQIITESEPLFSY